MSSEPCIPCPVCHGAATCMLCDDNGEVPASSVNGGERVKHNDRQSRIAAIAETIFQSSPTALRALSRARDEAKRRGWSDSTQRAVTDAIMRLFAERKRLAGRVVAP